MRHSEEFLVEDTNENCRPLAKIDNFIEDLLGRVYMGTSTLRFDLRNAIQDNLATALGRQNAILLEDMLVIGRRSDNVLPRT